MRYIKFESDCNYCGCDIEDYAAYPDTITDKELDEICEDFINETQARYEYLATDDISEDDYETEEEYQQAIEDAEYEFWSDVGGCWTEISKEEYEECRGSNSYIIDEDGK